MPYAGATHLLFSVSNERRRHLVPADDTPSQDDNTKKLTLSFNTL